jgi:hypothetical protein
MQVETDLEIEELSFPRADIARRSPWTRVAIVGLLTCIVIYLIDITVLNIARYQEWKGRIDVGPALLRLATSSGQKIGLCRIVGLLFSNLLKRRILFANVIGSRQVS